jgi:hypothetical protein
MFSVVFIAGASPSLRVEAIQSASMLHIIMCEKDETNKEERQNVVNNKSLPAL